MKPEPALVYACDRKFTLSSAPNAWAGDAAAGPRQLRSRLTTCENTVLKSRLCPHISRIEYKDGTKLTK